MNCGTEKGLLQHKARNEPPCKWCIKFRDDPAPPVKHVVQCGTANGRAKHRRDGTQICDPCRLAYNADNRARNAKRARPAQVTGEIQHGTVRGYQQHKSRGDADCPPCRQAANEKRRQYKKAANQ